ncbi:hypothetical protein LINGRAHAP2_LOCUS4936, partial [Linum grandiflorum]
MQNYKGYNEWWSHNEHQSILWTSTGVNTTRINTFFCAWCGNCKNQGGKCLNFLTGIPTPEEIDFIQQKLPFTQDRFSKYRATKDVLQKN